MTAQIEIKDGKVCFAFTGTRNSIFHLAGTQVSNDLTPEQMMVACGADWEVKKYPTFFVAEDGVQRGNNKAVLVRAPENHILDTVSLEWKPLQNSDAFQFFTDFVEVGDMEMDTAGVNDDGRRVWAMARIKKTVEILKGDIIQPYMLLSSPHVYGAAIDVRRCFTRVVGYSTMAMPFREGNASFVKTNHRTEFKPDRVKKAIGVTENALEQYAANARFLASKKAKREDIVKFLKLAFPATGAKKETDQMSLSAERAMSCHDTQPGADKGRGTWWHAANTVAFYVDNIRGRSIDTRMESAFYGQGVNDKDRAFKLALEMAKAS